MRGKILQYNGSDGTGTIAADNQQYRFTIGVWKGSFAPVVGKAVDVIVENSQLSAVMIVPDDVLLREKTAELSGKLSTFVSGLGAGKNAGGRSGGMAGGVTPNAGEGAAVMPGPGTGLSLSGNAIVERYGAVMLGAYVLYVLGTLVFNAISISFLGTSQGRPLYDIANLMSQLGGGGGIKLLLLIAYASVVVPFVWRDKRGWLALTIPLLAVLGAIWSGIHAISAAAVGGGGGYGPGGGAGVSDLFTLGFGFYLSLAAAIVLAVGGVQRFLRER